MPVIPTLRRCRQEDPKFETGLGCLTRACLSNKKQIEQERNLQQGGCPEEKKQPIIKPHIQSGDRRKDNASREVAPHDDRGPDASEKDSGFK